MGTRFGDKGQSLLMPVVAQWAVDLKAARLALGLSQVAVGRLVGMAASHWCRYESGASRPTLRTMVRMADAVGCRLVVQLVTLETP